MVLISKFLTEIADIEAIVSDVDALEFTQSMIMQKAVVMSLINIGELSKHFSEAFIYATKSVAWKDIRSLRNLAAHNYEAIKMNNIWSAIEQDIPPLKAILIKQQSRLRNN